MITTLVEPMLAAYIFVSMSDLGVLWVQVTRIRHRLSAFFYTDGFKNKADALS